METSLPLRIATRVILNRAMILELPSEILLSIFDAYCDLEFVDYPRRSSLKRSVSSKTRHLKSSMLPMSQVCTAWRNLIFGTSYFWVTTISLYRYSQYQIRIHENSLLLEQSEDSDIDLFFSFASHVMPDPFDGLSWLESIVRPNKHRIRVFELLSLPSEHITRVGDIFARGYWTRLKALLLDVTESCLTPTPKLRAPNLQCVHTRGITWIGEIPFKCLTTLKFREPSYENSTGQFWISTALRSYIAHSTISLSTLILQLTHLKPAQIMEKEKLFLPQLTKLSFTTLFLKNLIQFMAFLQAPSLTELDAEATNENEPNSAPLISLDLHSIRRLSLNLSAKCFPPLFKHLSFRNATDIMFRASHYSPNHSLHRPSAMHETPVKFPKLQNLSVKWHQIGESYEQCSWFFSYFDFTTTSAHASLSFGLRSPHDRINIPDSPKFTCTSLDDLQHVTLPSLRHLRLANVSPLSAEQSSRKLLKASYVPFQRVKTLEVEGWIISQQMDFSGFAQWFPDVTRLVIKPLIFPILRQAFGRFTPENEMFSSLWNKVENGRPYFPKLQTLDLIFGNQIDLSESSFIPLEPLNAIKSIISARRRLGWPILTVRFDSFEPPGLCIADMGWFQENVDNVCLFEIEDDFAWYSNYYPYEG